MLDENVNDETTEKFNMQVRLENRIKYMQKDIDELRAINKKLRTYNQLKAETEQLRAERDQAFELVAKLLKLVDCENEDVKKLLSQYKDIIKKCKARYG